MEKGQELKRRYIASQDKAKSSEAVYVDCVTQSHKDNVSY